MKERAMKTSKTLYLEGLPENSSKLLLSELTGRYPGFEKLSVEKSTGTVVFDSHENAIAALAGLHKFKIDKEGTFLKASLIAK